MTYIPEILTGRIVDGTITDVDVNAANKDGAAGTPCMRTLGTGAQQALAGNTTIATQLSELSDANTAGAVDGSLLRYEASASEWQPTTAANLLLNDNGRLLLPGTGSTAGVLIGGDGLIYRASANLLRTPDSLTIDGAGTVSGRFFADGGFRINVQTVTDYAPNVTTDHFLIVDSAAATRTITLPASHGTGSMFVIKRVGANNVTIATADADTIDGQATFVLDVNYFTATVVSDGTNWYIG